MSGLISLRLADDLLLKLEREVARTGRARSDIVRDAVASYLTQQERDRFLADIARAARARGHAEALELAEEALPFDNESLRLSDLPAVHEAAGSFRARAKRRR